MTPPKIKASPLARRLAREGGIVLDGLLGTGPSGRIVADDIRQAAAVQATQATGGATHPQATQTNGTAKLSPSAMGAPAVGAPATGKAAADPFSPLDLAQALDRPHRVEALTPTRKVVASRLTESKQRIPHYALSANCRADALLALRASLNQAAAGAWKVSVNDLIVRAMVLALEDTPAANCAFDERGLVFWQSVDMAIAVATEDGLFTPVVRDAETLSLRELSDAIRDLAGRARTGKLKPQEYLGGSFSVSNLGMFGVSDFVAVINPPQAGILAVGAAEPTVYSTATGEFELGQSLRLTLSLDHRALDGAVGATLLQALRGHIESPLLLALPPKQASQSSQEPQKPQQPPQSAQSSESSQSPQEPQNPSQGSQKPPQSHQKRQEATK